MQSNSNTRRPRTLIVGAGIAGLTLAALMRQRGEEPVVVERESAIADKGYMLGLYPMGARVLHGLGLHDQYMERSISMLHYHIGNGKGEIIREYSLEDIAERYGAIQGISHGELVALLLEGVGDLPIRFGTTVTALHPHDEEVEVTFSDGSSTDFDLVVAADGLHSATRQMILDEKEYTYWSTGWGGWVFWLEPGAARLDTWVEYWGAGKFLGLYPVKDHLAAFIGGPTATAKEMGLEKYIAHVIGSFEQPVLPGRQVQPDSSDAYFWDFHDCRSAVWRKGRVVLLGDAATGFIPTAGVGASMAMESAAALSDELSRTDAKRVEQALDLYEKRHRKRVESAQESSRQLGKMMFIKSSPLAWERNQLLKFYTVEELVRSIAKIADEPI
ncbi:MAG: FAD-dependent monooxygenase [Anaerolineae bacterium]|nr:FAD-dependent monooxygenase [Anaerolineae bacterium]